MILVKPSYEILTSFGYHGQVGALRIIEKAGRVCYKSEDSIDCASYKQFIKGLMKRGHESVIEHASITVKFICDRGVSHELVRHRLASFSQESTRYCDYKGGVTFIVPPWLEFTDLNRDLYELNDDISWHLLAQDTRYWIKSMWQAEDSYNNLRDCGWTPEKARGVLPINLKTEIVVTANLREWRHILKLRAVGTTGKPHPQMLELMIPLLKEFKEKIPVIFDDLEATNESLF